jgi:hypothetical protein
MNFDTEFKKELVEKFNEKNLSPNSINLYIRNLEKLNDGFPLKNFNFLKDIDSICKELEKYKENTIRGYLISIVASLKIVNKKQYEKILKEYTEKMLSLAGKIKQDYKDGKIKEPTSDNWTSMNDIKLHLSKLEEKVSKFMNNKEINEHQYNDLLSYLVLSLYTLEEPRRNADYQKMKIVGQYSDNLPIDHNYTDLNKFIFNIYKTSKKHGKQEIDINPELKKVISIYVKHHPLINGKLKKNDNVDFLVYFNGKPLSSVNSITRILNKVFDKKIASSQIRKIYTTEKFGKDSELGKLLEEQRATAEKMGHTVETQNEYYIKDTSNIKK